MLNQSFGIRRRHHLPGRCQPSTISAWRLNFCVRDGNRWNPPAIVTGNRHAAASFASLSLACSAVYPHAENYTGIQFDPAITLCSSFPSASLRLSSASASFFRSLLRSSPRPISISKLPHYCAFTADLSTLSSSRGLTSLRYGSLLLEVGFTLRCLQRLSHPYFASLLCRWHDNSCTSGTSIPVLSY